MSHHGTGLQSRVLATACQAVKQSQEALKRVCYLQFPRPIYAQADLAKTPLAKVLESNGFDSSKPALFTCEGLLCYLPQV